MLRTRLWIGTALVIMLLLVLWLDLQFAPYFPILGILVAVVGFLGAVELRKLLPAALQPQLVLTLIGVELILASPWLALCANRLVPGLVTVTVASEWSMALFAA